MTKYITTLRHFVCFSLSFVFSFEDFYSRFNVSCLFVILYFIFLRLCRFLPLRFLYQYFQSLTHFLLRIVFSIVLSNASFANINFLQLNLSSFLSFHFLFVTKTTYFLFSFQYLSNFIFFTFNPSHGLQYPFLSIFRSIFLSFSLYLVFPYAILATYLLFFPFNFYLILFLLSISNTRVTPPPPPFLLPSLTIHYLLRSFNLHFPSFLLG